MKLTPIKFDAQFHDGVLEMDGKQFEWNGIKFVVHKKRPAYDWRGEPLCVSSVETGFGCGYINEKRSHVKAAEQAIAKFESMGIDKVRESIEKAKATVAPKERLTA
jgi:hypothetical protein